MRRYRAQLRALYRRYPRALLDEQIRTPGVHPARLRNPDAFLGLLRGIGLSPLDAYRVHAELGAQAVRLHPAGRVPRRYRRLQRHRSGVLAGAHPDLDLPHLVEAAALPKPSADELFDYLVDTLILSIRERP